MQVDAGVSSTCAVQTDGTVACWGDNPPATFTQVSAEPNLTCALERHASVTCWAEFAIAETP